MTKNDNGDDNQTMLAQIKYKTTLQKETGDFISYMLKC